MSTIFQAPRYSVNFYLKIVAEYSFASNHTFDQKAGQYIFMVIMKHNIRIYYEDTDFSGLVYHASYLRFMERGRTEFLRAQGIDQSALFEKGEGLAFAVRHMSIDFLKPARMDDLIQVETQIDEVRGASLIMAQTILRGDDLLIKAVVRIAALRGGKPIRLPSQLASHLACKKP